MYETGLGIEAIPHMHIEPRIWKLFQVQSELQTVLTV